MPKKQKVDLLELKETIAAVIKVEKAKESKRLLSADFISLSKSPGIDLGKTFKFEANPADVPKTLRPHIKKKRKSNVSAAPVKTSEPDVVKPKKKKKQKKREYEAKQLEAKRLLNGGKQKEIEYEDSGEEQSEVQSQKKSKAKKRKAEDSDDAKDCFEVSEEIQPQKKKKSKKNKTESSADTEDKKESLEIDEDTEPEKKLKSKKNKIKNTENGEKSLEKSEDTKPTRKQKKEKPISQYTIFVGNLPFETTKDDLEYYFSRVVPSLKSVRLPTERETGKPRGIAFIEVEGEVNYQAALSLDKSFMNGRRINVEYTCAGSKTSKNRQAKITSKNFKFTALKEKGIMTPAKNRGRGERGHGGFSRGSRGHGRGGFGHDRGGGRGRGGFRHDSGGGRGRGGFRQRRF